MCKQPSTQESTIHTQRSTHPKSALTVYHTHNCIQSYKSGCSPWSKKASNRSSTRAACYPHAHISPHSSMADEEDANQGNGNGIGPEALAPDSAWRVGGACVARRKRMGRWRACLPRSLRTTGQPTRPLCTIDRGRLGIDWDATVRMRHELGALRWPPLRTWAVPEIVQPVSRQQRLACGTVVASGLADDTAYSQQSLCCAAPRQRRWRRATPARRVLHLLPSRASRASRASRP